MTLPSTSVMRTLAVVPLLICMAWPAGVQAQSRYVMSTLKAPSTHPLDPLPFPLGFGLIFKSAFSIDSSDQVWGLTDYSVQKYIDRVGQTQERYERSLARWPAGTAATVSPVKVLPSPESAFHQTLGAIFSPDGTQALLSWSTVDNAVYDTKTGTLGPQTTRGEGLDVDNKGHVLLIGEEPLVPVEGGVAVAGDAPQGVWSSSGGFVALPLQSSQYGQYPVRVQDLNDAGVVVGFDSNRDVLGMRELRATMWSQGTQTKLDSRPGLSSEARIINDAGQVLARSYTNTCDDIGNCVVSKQQHGLLAAGVFKPIVPRSGSSYDVITPRGFSAQGVVYGRWSVIGGYRGFLWKNGVFTDVTDLVRGKGVSLPLGAVISDVVAVNAKGSMVALLHNRLTGKESTVRLTAQP